MVFWLNYIRNKIWTINTKGAYFAEELSYPNIWFSIGALPIDMATINCALQKNRIGVFVDIAESSY